VELIKAVIHVLVAADQQQLAEALLQALDSTGIIPAAGAAEGPGPSPIGGPGPTGQPPVAAPAPMPEQPIVPGAGGEGPTG